MFATGLVAVNLPQKARLPQPTPPETLHAQVFDRRPGVVAGEVN
jgi:hypothetical protein